MKLLVAPPIGLLILTVVAESIYGAIYLVTRVNSGFTLLFLLPIAYVVGSSHMSVRTKKQKEGRE